MGCMAGAPAVFLEGADGFLHGAAIDAMLHYYERDPLEKIARFSRALIFVL